MNEFSVCDAHVKAKKFVEMLFHLFTKPLFYIVYIYGYTYLNFWKKIMQEPMVVAFITSDLLP